MIPNHTMFIGSNSAGIKHSYYSEADYKELHAAAVQLEKQLAITQHWLDEFQSTCAELTLKVAQYESTR